MQRPRNSCHSLEWPASASNDRFNGDSDNLQDDMVMGRKLEALLKIVLYDAL